MVTTVVNSVVRFVVTVVASVLVLAVETRVVAILRPPEWGRPEYSSSHWLSEGLFPGRLWGSGGCGGPWDWGWPRGERGGVRDQSKKVRSG